MTGHYTCHLAIVLHFCLCVFPVWTNNMLFVYYKIFEPNVNRDLTIKKTLLWDSKIRIILFSIAYRNLSMITACTDIYFGLVLLSMLTYRVFSFRLSKKRKTFQQMKNRHCQVKILVKELFCLLLVFYTMLSLPYCALKPYHTMRLKLLLCIHCIDPCHNLVQSSFFTGWLLLLWHLHGAICKEQCRLVPSSTPLTSSKRHSSWLRYIPRSDNHPKNCNPVWLVISPIIQLWLTIWDRFPPLPIIKKPTCEGFF